MCEALSFPRFVLPITTPDLSREGYHSGYDIRSQSATLGKATAVRSLDQHGGREETSAAGARLPRFLLSGWHWHEFMQLLRLLDRTHASSALPGT